MDDDVKAGNDVRDDTEDSGCPSCASVEKCECGEGPEACRAGGRCACDAAKCPCSARQKREARGCLGIAIPPGLPGGGWLVAVVVALLVIGVGVGAVCTRQWGDVNPPSADPSASPATPSASPSPQSAVDLFGGDEAKSPDCEAVTPKLIGDGLEGSKLECLGFYFGNLDADGATKAGSRTGLVIAPGEYVAVVGRVNGTPTQVGVGITIPGTLTNTGSPDAVDPIGRGGVTLAAFGDSEGWSKWPLLNAADRFSKTGREIIGFRDGTKFTALIPASEFGADIGAAKLLVEAFKRKTPDGRDPYDADPTAASAAIVSWLFNPPESPPRDLFVMITPRVILEK